MLCCTKCAIVFCLCHVAKYLLVILGIRNGDKNMVTLYWMRLRGTVDDGEMASGRMWKWGSER